MRGLNFIMIESEFLTVVLTTKCRIAGALFWRFVVSILNVMARSRLDNKSATAHTVTPSCCSPHKINVKIIFIERTKIPIKAGIRCTNHQGLSIYKSALDCFVTLSMFEVLSERLKIFSYRQYSSIFRFKIMVEKSLNLHIAVYYKKFCRYCNLIKKDISIIFSTYQ